MQPGESKNESLKAETTDAPKQPEELRALPFRPLTIYDKDGVSVIATETRDTLELAVSEPDQIYVSVEVDRNQNGQFDRLVDVAYKPQAAGNLCPQYLIDIQHNTPRGGFASSAYLRDFKDEYGRRQFVLVLPKKEISFDLPSARFVLVIRDNAQWRTSYYPPERFLKATDVPYAIKQNVAPQVLPSAAGLGFPSGDGDRQKDGWNASTGLYKVGGNVSAPVPLKQVNAEFSDEARRAKYQGVCLVGLIVDAQGNPQNVHIVRALGMGLDEKAMEAVRKYKFKPAMRDGKTPVAVYVNVEVNFRLYTPADMNRPDAMDALLRSIAGKGAKDCGDVAYQPSAKDQKKVSAAGDCAQSALAQNRPFYVRYTNHLPVSETHLIDGFASFGMATNGNGAMSAITSRVGADGLNHNSIVSCPKPIQLTRNSWGGLTCSAPQDGVGTPLIGGQLSGVKAEAQTVQPTDAGAAVVTLKVARPSSPNGTGTQSGEGKQVDVPEVLKNGADTGISTATGSAFEGSATAEDYKISGSISPPILKVKVLPSYSDELARSKDQGTVVASLIVDAQGNTQKIHFIRSLGMGQDERVLEALRGWKFTPAMKNGEIPVSEAVDVQFNFRICKQAGQTDLSNRCITIDVFPRGEPDTQPPVSMPAPAIQ
jgi:TonB family protein